MPPIWSDGHTLIVGGTFGPITGYRSSNVLGLLPGVPSEGRIGGSPRELTDKHAEMGKTVSGYWRHGLRLVENAARGYFPLV